MKKAIQRMIVIVIIATIGLFAVACTGETANPPEQDIPEPTEAEGNVTLKELSAYQIVYNDNSAVVTDAITKLRNTLKNITQAEPSLVTDSAPETEREFIIGTTARSENKYQPALKAHDYKVCVSDQKILIFGGSDDALAEAVYAFIDNKINWTTPEIAYNSIKLNYTYDYLYTDITICGKSVSEGLIQYEEALLTAAKNCSRKIAEACGTSVSLADRDP